jgi:hypothetical protein
MAAMPAIAESLNIEPKRSGKEGTRVSVSEHTNLRVLIRIEASPQAILSLNKTQRLQRLLRQSFLAATVS